MQLNLFLKEDKKTFRNVAFDDDGEVDFYGDGLFTTFKLKDLGTNKKPFKFYSLNTLDADYNAGSN